VPRYVPIAAPNDCVEFGDCGASYFPKLGVNTTALTFNATSLNLGPTQYPIVSNTGGGNFVWTTNVEYLSGAIGSNQWLLVQPSSGINNGTLQVNIFPGTLAPGVYTAQITIDGGPTAGTAVIPVTLFYAYQAPTPVVINAVNPANMAPGILVPGSQAAILGSLLTGHNISVTFNGTPAQVLASVSALELVVQVPYNMSGQTSALIVVTIDGSSSTPGLLVPIGDSNPAIFPGSVLNEDNTGNSQSNGAAAGSTISIYATGLPSAGYYSGKIHDRTITGDQLVYAGVAPTLIGVQLVQMIVPPDLPSLNTGTAVCGGPTTDDMPCSAYANLTIVAAPVGSRSTPGVPDERPRGR